ncbi:MAG: DUF7482 domain-containing protein [Actinomycetota bacterium]
MSSDRVIPSRLQRREFFGWASRRAAGVVLAGGAMPALLAACGDDDNPTIPAAENESPTTATTATAIPAEGKAIIGDVIDFKLASDQWEGRFGLVTMRLHKGAFNGKDVYFIRTDASDQAFATAEKLVWVPKLKPLTADGLSGQAYLVEGGAQGQGTILSSEPGRDDYTPAWTVHTVTWKGQPRLLASVDEVKAAERVGDVTVVKTDIVVNAELVKWSTGALSVDPELRSYLGRGPLIEAPDTTAMKVTFKLGQCFPGTRYFAASHSIKPAAAMTQTTFAPRLHAGPSKAGAVGRTNVFMNGIEGPGPMGFQPSVFDFDAGNPAWSPYWDHYAYQWKDTATPRVVRTQDELFQARDAGEIEEFPGMPDTQGEVFSVNCPAPVLAPISFTG